MEKKYPEAQYYAPQGKEHVGGYGSGNMNRKAVGQATTAALYTIVVLILLIIVGGGSYFLFSKARVDNASSLTTITVTATTAVPTSIVSAIPTESVEPSIAAAPVSTIAAAYGNDPALTNHGWAGAGPACSDGDNALFAGTAAEGRMVICANADGLYYRGLWGGQFFDSAQVRGTDANYTVDATPVLFRINKNELSIEQNGSVIRTYRFVNSWVLQTQ